MIHPILERFEHAKTYSPLGYNCISAAFYLVGLDEVELSLKDRPPGHIQCYNPRIVIAQYLEEALFFGKEIVDNPGYILHLMVLHPYDASIILERPKENREIRENWLSPQLNLDRFYGLVQLAFFKLG